MPYQTPTEPRLQLALDFLNADQALRAAAEAQTDGAIADGTMWIEAGTPLIKSEGLEVVRRLRATYPGATIVADMKVMDAGRTEVEAAQKAGADLVTVLAVATDATLRECVEAGRHVGIAIVCDLVGIASPTARAREVEALGVDLVSVHTPIDQQMEGRQDFSALREVAAAITVPVACAGGLTAGTVADALAAGATVLIVGGAVTKAPDAAGAVAEIRAAMAGASVPEDVLYRRVDLIGVREVFGRVSTPHLSDAMHRGGALRGLVNRNPGVRFAGPTRTVLTVPGDWAKPVEAIDGAEPGSVLVIDAAGRPPALWGGLATRTAVARGLAGVVINGACRDIEEITGSPLGLWSSAVTPDAGEPKGVGTIGVVVTFGGQTIHPGDWLVADDNGIIVVSASSVVAMANRAQDVMERERRIAAEIDGGRSLAEIMELKRWESAR